MTDAKLREFTLNIDKMELKQIVCTTVIDGARYTSGFGPNEVIQVREISPELDAAVKQMVEALKDISRNEANLDAKSQSDDLSYSGEVANEALDAYRRATEVGK